MQGVDLARRRRQPARGPAAHRCVPRSRSASPESGSRNSFSGRCVPATTVSGSSGNAAPQVRAALSGWAYSVLACMEGSCRRGLAPWVILADGPGGLTMPLFAWAYFIVMLPAAAVNMLGQITSRDWELRLPAGTSRYLDIAAELRDPHPRGEWAPGANLPRMADLAREYGVNRDTLARAIAVLEAEGLVWAVPRRGTVVTARHVPAAAAARELRQAQRRGRTSPGYSFPSASAQEVWVHHVPRTARLEKLTDPRLARMLGVPEGTEVMRRHRVTGPAGEPPFQTNDSWIHPRGDRRRSRGRRRAAEAPETGCTGSRRPGTGPSHGGRRTGPGCRPRKKRTCCRSRSRCRCWRSSASAPRARTAAHRGHRCTSSRATG